METIQETAADKFVEDDGHKGIGKGLKVDAEA